MVLSKSEDITGAIEGHTDSEFRTGSDHLPPFDRLALSMAGTVPSVTLIAAAFVRPIPTHHGNMSSAMDSIRYKLAVLNFLAKCPGGRAALDEVRREVAIIMASGDQIEPLNHLSALADVDIFQSGLVLPDDAGLQVTPAGLLLLLSLQSNSGLSPATGQVRAQATETVLVPPNVTSETLAVDRGEKINSKIPDGVDDANHDRLSAIGENRTAIEALDGASRNAPAFLQRSFGANVDAERNPPPLTRLVALISAKKRFLIGLWRRHLVQDASIQGTERPVGRMVSAALAFLSVLVVAACFGAAIALDQIKSLKSEIAMLHRELRPFKERLGKLEQFQQEEAQSKADASNPGGGTGQALNLSREEAQLIREYIKPAPSAGTAAPAVNVGDLIGGSMIPLPSSITEKVPKLMGARFTIRNGAIIISTRNSRRADAVLTPN